MEEKLKKYLKPFIAIVFLIAIGGFIYIGSELRTKEAEVKVGPAKLISAFDSLTLEVDGYGFVVGDIVQGKEVQPVVGDVIVYDPFKNRSRCFSMGPNMSLGKIVGVPGENFSLQNDKLKIRAEIIGLGKDYSQQKAVFGGQKYESLVGKNITLQTGEYLIDKFTGLECFKGELNETGSSIPYNRFTVNEESIMGVIDKKIGHDNQAEKEFRSIIY